MSEDGATGAANDPPHLDGLHGRAALLLTECLIHELIENQTISVGQAVNVVESACEVAEETGRDGELCALLEPIANSLRRDL